MKSPLKLLLCLVTGLLLIALGALSFKVLSGDYRDKWLRQAVWDNDLSKTKLLVRLGADVNYSTGNGTALHGAASNGNTELMTYLIQHGAKVDDRTKYGVTPLWEARKAKWTEAEQLLLSHGADPDTTTHVSQP